jgi:hypothetical protein
MANPTDVNRVTSTLLSIALVLTYSFVITVGGHAAMPACGLLFIFANARESSSTAQIASVFAWLGVAAAIAHCFIRVRTIYITCAWLLPVALILSLINLSAQSDGLIPITVIPFVASLIAFAIRFCLLAVPKP